jgi:DNA (cytosine-5)-methyltransferase 1
VGRVANGIPFRVDRLKGIGNSVVPQIPEMMWLMIKDFL